MFLDESGASTQMTRCYGRSPVGQRLVCRVPQGHYQTTTMIAAVRLQGPQAPWLFEGPIDGELFLAWVKPGLVPVLRRDDVVILDNLSTHKVAGVLEAIDAAGARLEYQLLWWCVSPCRRRVCFTDLEKQRCGKLNS